jgi:hypothetical protein
MVFSSVEIGKTYQVKDIKENIPCNNCPTCTRLKLMEIGFDIGCKFKVNRFQDNIWVIDFLTDSGMVEQTIALRDEETIQIILED